MKYFLSVVLLFIFSTSFSQTLSTSFVAKAKYSNKQVVWYEYDYWLDGSKLSDAKNKNKFNDILFKKVGNKYYKAQFEGTLNAEDWGVKKDYEGGKPEENSMLIQAMIDYLPSGYTASVYIPAGNYYFSKTIVIDAKPIHLFGDNGTIFANSTKLYFPPATTGIVVARHGTSVQETIIERICVIGNSSQPGENDGFTILARAKIRDCTAQGFVHYGFSVWANMNDGNDASGSVFESCHSLENKLDGFAG